MENYKNMSPSSQEMWGPVYDEFKKAIHNNLVPKKLYDRDIKRRDNDTRKIQLELRKTTQEFEKLKGDHKQLTEKYNQLKDQRLDDSLKIENLEAVIKNLRTENAKLQDVKNESEKLKSDHSQLTETYNQLKDERLGDGLKIDVLQAEMKAFEAEKKTFDVKFDAVSSKLKLKTHEYDSLIKSKAKSQDIKIFVTPESQVQKSSIGTQTIKQEPEEIGVVNVPASSSSQPKPPPAKPGTKRTSSNDDNRKITKAKRKKIDSTTRLTRKSTGNKPKFTCMDCHYDWGSDVVENHIFDPDKTGVSNPRHTIQTFSSIDDYKIHRHEVHDAIYTELVNHYQSYNGRTDCTCKICGLKFTNKDVHDMHVDLDHINLTGMSNQEIFGLYMKYY